MRNGSNLHPMCSCSATIKAEISHRLVHKINVTRHKVLRTVKGFHH